MWLMRLVQVANFYGPRSGGLRTAIDRLGAEYCGLGHEVFLIVPGRHPSVSLLPTGVTRITVPALPIPYTGGYRVLRAGPVTAILDSLKPHGLEVSDRLSLRPLGRWGRENHVTTIMIAHERLDRLIGMLLPQRAATRMADLANRHTAANYHAVMCMTKFAREEFDRIGARNTITVPLGVDLETFHPRRYSEQLRRRLVKSSHVLLVHCGRLSVEKRADRSIDALAELLDSGIDARLVVVGDGPLRGRLQRQAARLPVHFTGFVHDRLSLATFLASADVALAPGPHETFGLAALEALACGTPAVVSQHSALPEIVSHDSGTCTDDNPAAIAEGVIQITSRPRAQWRTSARQRAEQFSWSRAASRMLTALVH